MSLAVKITKREYIARLIAHTFHDEANLSTYRNCCKKYALATVLRAFAEAKSTPQDRIRKSRVALFFYLIKTYAYE